MAGRSCTVCTHPQHAQANAMLAAGARIADVARDFRFSESAVWRHRARHLQASILRESRATATTGTADLVGRLAELLDDLTAARNASLLSGNVAGVVRAAAAEVHAVEVLMDRLQIDGAEIARELAEAEALARAVGAVVRRRPAFAPPLVEALRERGRGETADALSRLAEQSLTAVPTERTQT